MRFFAMALLLLCCRANAATITAASSSYSDVNTAVGSASNGDTVEVPAGSSTWSSTLTVNKNITLTTNNSGPVTITDNSSTGAINMEIPSAGWIRLSGFVFIASATHTSSGLVDATGASSAGSTTGGFRIDHCKFTIGSAVTRGVVPESTYGLIDHCFFNVTASSGSIQCISVFGSDGNDAGFSPWTRSLSLGTTNAVVIENCQFSYPNYTSFSEDCIDAYTGARLIVRYCGFLNDSIGFHGTDSGGWRSPVSFEIYSNNWTNNMSGQLRACTIRGGTGVIYGNRYFGSGGGFGGFVQILYRILPCLESSWGSWELCDGSNYKIQSGLPANTWESSTTGTHGFCTGDNETVGTFGNACSGGTYSRYFDGSGTGGYPARDQPGIKPGQIVEAVWANDNDGKTLGTHDADCPQSAPNDVANYLVPGLTYTNASIAKPGYTALAYPHPLLGGAAPAAPSGLSATAISSAQINLSWTDNASDEGGFEIRRDSTTITGGISADATSYGVSGLSPGTLYSFEVRATNSSGQSAWSSSASATTASVASYRQSRKARAVGGLR